MTAAVQANLALYSAAYRCVSMDPPWPERGGGKVKRGADRHYPLMSVAEILAMIPASTPMLMAAGSAHLWCWVTDNYLEAGLQLLRACGFTYKRMLVWVKVRTVHERKRALLRRRMSALRWRVSLARLQIGLGQYLRGAHEVCLLGVRGDAAVPEPADRMPSVVFAPRGRHSAKPAEAYAVIERVSPGPRAEMFARHPRDGWAVWGNESGSDELWAEAAGGSER